MSFTQAAGRLAGLAGWLLHWPPDWFWQSTPEELAAIFGALNSEYAPAPPDPVMIHKLQEMFPDG
jgi:hypothetical protein